MEVVMLFSQQNTVNSIDKIQDKDLIIKDCCCI